MKKSVLFFFAFIVSVILVLYAINVFPIPGTDSIVFIPPALLYAKGFGLANPLYYVATFTDLTHTNRFNYYVPFYPFLLGVLSQVKPAIKTIFIFCSFFSVLNIFLYSSFLVAHMPKQVGGTLKAIILSSIIYVATYFLPTVGRPEVLAAMLVFLIYWLYQRRGSYRAIVYNSAICLLFALMLATQIICFYFCFLFFITYELANGNNLAKTIGANIARGIIILLVFCIVLSLTPNGLFNTINGIRLHISYVLGRSDRSLSLFVYYWLLAPLNFGFLVIFLIAALFYVKQLAVKVRQASSVQRLLIIAVQALIAFGIGKFILYASPTVYNATQFILPVSAYIVLNLAGMAKSPQRSVLNSLALATYVSGVIIFVRGLVLFIDYMNDGKTYDNAKTIVSQVARQYPGIYVTKGLWPLLDNPNDVKIYDKDEFKKGNIVIVQQAYHSFPGELAGKCTILLDWSTAEKRKLFGISITNRPQGYSFVVCRIN